MRVKVGLITRPSGRWGEVRVMTSYPPGFFINKRVYVLNREFLVVKARRLRKNMMVAKLEGIDDISEAELLRNLYVEVEEKDLQPLGENEFYGYQLLGCEVYDEKLGFLGKVVDLHEWGPYWTLEIRNDKEILIPFVSEFILDVDVKGKIIKAKLPEGYVENF